MTFKDENAFRKSIQKAILGQPSEFKTQICDELRSRAITAIESMKPEVAKTLIPKE